MMFRWAFAALLVAVVCGKTTENPQNAAALFGAKYKPGDVITRTDFSDVDNALDDVLKAGGILEGRRCAIGVANLGETDLTSPKWYLYSGSFYSAPPYTIPPRQTGLNLAHKKAVVIWGTTGLLSYDIEGTDYKVVMLWQVPWNKVLYKIKYNLKIYHKTVETNENMFDQMMDYAGAEESSGWIEKEEYGIKVKGSITNKDFAKFYVSVDASEYDRLLPPQLHTECKTNTLWLGKYCRQECVPTGYCWVNRKCDSAADCTGPLQCHGSCKKT